MKRIPQFELPAAGEVFNLAGERGVDPERQAADRRAAEQRAYEAAEYSKRCQKLLTDCPGFIGADAPTGPELAGRVVVDPGAAVSASLWLRKRFRVRRELEIDVDRGIVIEIMPRAAGKGGGGRRRRSDGFVRAVQTEFDL